MKIINPENIRNVSIVGHSGTGKTSLVESILFDCDEINRRGSVEKGTTTTDFEPEEIKRTISIDNSIAPCNLKDHKINILDTPGYLDFVGELLNSLRVCDGVVLLCDSIVGVEVGTEKIWTYCENLEIPIIITINKMDRESTDFYKVLDQLRNIYGSQVVALNLPIGKEDDFKGWVNLLEQKAFIYESEKKIKDTEIPEEMIEKVKSLRENLIETIVETNDEMLMKYLDGEELSQDELKEVLGSAVKNRKIFPVTCSSGLKNIGTEPILDMIIDLLPSPLEVAKISGKDPKSKEDKEIEASPKSPFIAYVYKTMVDPFVGKLSMFRIYTGEINSNSVVFNANNKKSVKLSNMYSTKGKTQTQIDKASIGDFVAVSKLEHISTGDTLCDSKNPIVLAKVDYPPSMENTAIAPLLKGDEEKISNGLSKLMEEDPTFSHGMNFETKQHLIYGMGDVHLSVIIDKLKRKFGVGVKLIKPKVAYKETVRKTVKVEGKYKKQSGGRGQYGHVWLEVKPLDRGTGFEFIETIFGGAIPKGYIQGVEKGVRAALQEGAIAGYPVTDISVNLYDGSYHSVDSSEIAFKIASAMAFRKGVLDGNPVLLEPIMEVEVEIPDDYVGDIIGDLNARRGKILGIEPEKNIKKIKALVPQAEMFNYSKDLRSITRGRGSFSMNISHSEEVPPHIQEKVIEESKKEEK